VSQNKNFAYRVLRKKKAIWPGIVQQQVNALAGSRRIGVIPSVMHIERALSCHIRNRFMLVNAPNCLLSLVLASVVQGDAVNCNTCVQQFCSHPLLWLIW